VGAQTVQEYKEIIIVGGGSAGWMTAAFLIKSFPNKKITLIEAPNIPIVGVGESTIGGIRNYCEYLGINIEDFLRYTNGSLKMSIKFTDFYKENSGGFHYPFGLPFFSENHRGQYDWLVAKALNPELPIQDYVDAYFPAASLFQQNKYSTNDHGLFDNFTPSRDVALHFDSTKFGSWLRERYAIPRGVKHIIAEVKHINSSFKNGVESLILDNGDQYKADLYIDCTGWKSLLLGQTLKEPFISYKDILPNNKAWATQLPYIDKEKEIEPFTNCTAIANGWVWNIPLWSRIGTGYVYSNEFISEEDALVEFKNHLSSNKMLFPRNKDQIESLQYRDISMRVGIHERTWVNNVIAIGLSAGFIEPLESNGLFTIHEFLFRLLKTLQRPQISQIEKDFYNMATFELFNNFAQFVSQHYLLSQRDDSEYWRAARLRPYNKITNNLNKNIEYRSLLDNKYHNKNIDQQAGINYISVGMNYFVYDQMDIAYDLHYGHLNLKDYENIYWPALNKNKKRWMHAANFEPTLYEYLNKNIYRG
jgi:tryptophan halogenase